MMRVLRAVGIGLAAVGVLFATALFSFLGAVVHPFFWNAVVVLAVAVAGIALWAVRDVRREAEESRAVAETRGLPIDAIAGHLPDPPRRRRVGIPVWLRTQCVRAGRAIKEAAR